MPPKFMKDSFLFAESEEVPEHEEAWPREELRDRRKWYVEGYDTFSAEPYPLAIDVDTEADALLLATARLRQLEVKQPSLDSGGQSWEGIQDQVYIFKPLGKMAIRHNPPRSQLFANSPENPNP